MVTIDALKDRQNGSVLLTSMLTVKFLEFCKEKWVTTGSSQMTSKHTVPPKITHTHTHTVFQIGSDEKMV